MGKGKFVNKKGTLPLLLKQVVVLGQPVIVLPNIKFL
jgi:hypothetical protein